MSNKRLQSDIEKCLRDCQNHMQIYDCKWQELKSYNEAVANKAWGRVEEVCHPAPPLIIFSWLQVAGGADSAHTNAHKAEHMITVDVSRLTEKQTSDAREKLKTELENLMKKVYRCRQQIIDWLNNASITPETLRSIGFTREHLLEAKKEIETRSRRGKVYYLRGTSSEDTRAGMSQDLGTLLDSLKSFASALDKNIDVYTAYIEDIARQVAPSQQVPNNIFGNAIAFNQLSQDEQLEILSCAIDACATHAEYLDQILNGLPDPLRVGPNEHPDLSFYLYQLSNIIEKIGPLVRGTCDPSSLNPTAIYGPLLEEISARRSSNSQPSMDQDIILEATSGNADKLALEEFRNTSNGSARTAAPSSESRTSGQLADLRNRWPSPPRQSAAPLHDYRSAAQSAEAAAHASNSKTETPSQVFANHLQRLLPRNLPKWVEDLRPELASGVMLCTNDRTLNDCLDTELERRQLLEQVRQSLETCTKLYNVDECLPLIVKSTPTMSLPMVTSQMEWRGRLVDLNNKTLILQFKSNVNIEVLVKTSTWSFGRLVEDPEQRGWFPTACVR